LRKNTSANTTDKYYANDDSDVSSTVSNNDHPTTDNINNYNPAEVTT
jgi:hypothetical protein